MKKLEEFGTEEILDIKKEIKFEWAPLAKSLKEEAEKELEFIDGLCQYSISDNKFIPCGNTCKTLSSGVYAVEYTNQTGYYFAKKSLVVDDLIFFEDGQNKEILDEINKFWSRAEYFEKYGYLHKRGVLLYGKAGGGKSSLVSQIMSGIVKLGGIVVLCANPNNVVSALSLFRKIEPTRRVVIVYEDIDSIIKTYGESEVLSLLDGEAQINHVLNLATTNYPERLEKRIVNRPRRFDRVIRVGMPSYKMRKAYFIQKLKLDDSEVNAYVSASEGFTFAAMAELVISVKCLGNDFKETVEHLKSLAEFNPVSTDDEGTRKVGFGI